jgi:hypothetical protein
VPSSWIFPETLSSSIDRNQSLVFTASGAPAAAGPRQRAFASRIFAAGRLRFATIRTQLTDLFPAKAAEKLTSSEA